MYFCCILAKILIHFSKITIIPIDMYFQLNIGFFRVIFSKDFVLFFETELYIKLLEKLFTWNRWEIPYFSEQLDLQIPIFFINLSLYKGRFNGNEVSICARLFPYLSWILETQNCIYSDFQKLFLYLLFRLGNPLFEWLRPAPFWFLNL